MFKIEKTKQEKMIAKQKAFDYCLYMIFTSYYKSTKCMNKSVETQLFLYYKELNNNASIDLEKKCIDIIESKILPEIPEEYINRSVKVHFIKLQNSIITGIKVFTEDYEVIVFGTIEKGRPEITMRLHCKRDNTLI